LGDQPSSRLYGGAHNAGVENAEVENAGADRRGGNAAVENAGVDRVSKAVRINYSVDSVWLAQFPRVRTNNLEHTPTGSAKRRH